MRIPKQYGSYRVDRCPFCDSQATTQNSQKIPVCAKHRDKELIDLKCQCGDYIDIMSGKYGPFGNCMRCGNVRFSRVLEINEQRIKKTGSALSANSPDYKDKPKPKGKSRLNSILSFDELKKWLEGN